MNYFLLSAFLRGASFILDISIVNSSRQSSDAKFGSAFRIPVPGKVCVKMELKLRIPVSDGGVKHCKGLLYVGSQWALHDQGIQN